MAEQPKQANRPESSSPKQAADLLELLRRQRALYRELSSLAARQRHLISGDQPEALLDLLARRQQIVEQLQAVHAELSRAGGPAGGWSEQARDQAEALLAESRALAQQILERDREDGELLAVRKASLAASLTQIRGGQAANRAYARAAAPGRDPSADLTA